jgi:hypothetical protein
MTPHRLNSLAENQPCSAIVDTHFSRRGECRNAYFGIPYEAEGLESLEK